MVAAWCDPVSTDFVEKREGGASSIAQGNASENVDPLLGGAISRTQVFLANSMIAMSRAIMIRDAASAWPRAFQQNRTLKA